MNKQQALFYILLYIFPTAAKTPQCVFLHGIVDSMQQANRYTQVLPETYYAFNFPDALAPQQQCSLNALIYYATKQITHFKKYLNRQQSYLGQQNDVDYAANKIRNLNRNTMLYGVSRGGSVALKYLAQSHDTHIQGLIVESAPNDVTYAAQTAQAYLGIPCSPNRIMKFLFPSFVPNKATTVQQINNLATYPNKNIPILLIHSATDTRVPITDSEAIYCALRALGFTNTYLVKLPQGRHSFIVHDNPTSPEAIEYMTAVHSFYKLYNLAQYNAAYATLSKEALHEKYQPDHLQLTQDITQKAITRAQALQSIYKKSVIRNIVAAAIPIAAISMYTLRKT